jgi:transposase
MVQPRCIKRFLGSARRRTQRSRDSSVFPRHYDRVQQGNTLTRFLLVEAAQAAARCNPNWRRRYLHLMMRREKRIAKVAMARKLAVRLYWMWRNNWQYSQLVEFGSNAGKLGTVHGMK